jgi:hypothetical protein
MAGPGEKGGSQQYADGVEPVESLRVFGGKIISNTVHLGKLLTVTGSKKDIIMHENKGGEL